ncbi:MAG: hypothetical protein ACI90Y_001239, partial [Polaromonas sp.]
EVPDCMGMPSKVQGVWVIESSDVEGWLCYRRSNRWAAAR